MKHLILPSILLITLLVFSIFSAMFVTSTIDQTEADLVQAVFHHNLQETDKMAAFLAQTTEYWTSRQFFFGMVLKHEEVDQVSGELERLRSYAASDDSDDFLSNCAALLATLDHIREMEWPYLQNIL